MSLERAHTEDAQILPLAKALDALPGLYPTRWCGGHTDATLEALTLASSTRYDGMTHPPSPATEYWIELMCDPGDNNALRSLETLALASQEPEGDEDNEPLIVITAPWEGITITLIGQYEQTNPDDLAQRIHNAILDQMMNPLDPNQASNVKRRIDGYEQRSLLT